MSQSTTQSDRAKHTASKYDFVKVKVWLGDGMTHYYILSRFLISRVLTVTKIPYMKAVKISLEVKKFLIDNNKLEVTQAGLEAILFDIMESKGFGTEYIERYKMVNRFHQERRPLIIVICGAPCTGKSSLAQQLASRFNMPNVLQTDLFYELLHSDEDMPIHRSPLWERSDLDDYQLVTEFQKECQVVRKSIDGDLVKTIRDGKSIIIEGLHLDPGLYLYEFGKYGIRHLVHSRADGLLPSQQSMLHQDDALLVEPVNAEPLNPDESIQEAAALEPEDDLARLQGLSHQVQTSGAHGSKQGTASSYILDSTRQMLHEKLSRETIPGTKLLFALASVADKLSPVLSSTVSAFYNAGKQDAALDDHQTLNSQSTKPEWFTQQLHKAYHGLADTCKPSSSSLQSAGTCEQHIGHQATANASACSSEHRRQSPVPTSLQEAAGPEAPGAPAAQACYSRAVDPKEHTREPSQDVLSVQQTCSAQSQQAPEPQHGGQPPSKDIQAQPDSPGQGSAAAMQVESNHAESCGSQEVPDRVPAAVALEGPFEHGEQPLHQVTHPDQGEQDSSECKQEEPGVQEKPKKGKSPATPVFVPIVVAMDQKDHKVMVEEWYSRQMAATGQMSDAGISDQAMTAAADATYRRLQLLQDHLCSYTARNVPVVTVDLANFTDTMDQLHDYLLQCIENAMQQP